MHFNPTDESGWWWKATAAVGVYLDRAQEPVGQPVCLAAHVERPACLVSGDGDVDCSGGLGGGTPEEGGRGRGRIVRDHQHAAGEQRVDVGEGVFAPFGGDQLVLARRDGGQPAALGQAMKHLASVIVGAVQDRHRFFDGDHRLLFPLQVQDQPGFEG